MARRTASGLVGLDIGTSGIRAVQVKRARGSGRFEIVRAAAVPLPRGSVRNGVITDQPAVVKALKSLWRTGGFSTRKVALGLADGGVMTRQLELPWMPPEDFRTALRYQVNDALPVDLSTVELDYHLLGEAQRLDDHGQTVELNRILIVAANREAIDAEAQTVRKARLEPVVADSAAFALIRAACHGVLPDNQDTHAIADIGADQLTVVVHQGGQPRFIRTITNLGGETATMAIAERLGIEPSAAEELKVHTGLNGPAPVVAPIAESSVFAGSAIQGVVAADPRTEATIEILNPWATTIIAEIRNSIDYFQASDPTAQVGSLTICGRTAILDGLVDRIATQIPLPVRMMDPFVDLAHSHRAAKHAGQDSSLAVAIGLALGESA